MSLLQKGRGDRSGKDATTLGEEPNYNACYEMVSTGAFMNRWFYYLYTIKGTDQPTL